jgi:hypothetical protein
MVCVVVMGRRQAFVAAFWGSSAAAAAVTDEMHAAITQAKSRTWNCMSHRRYL